MTTGEDTMVTGTKAVRSHRRFEEWAAAKQNCCITCADPAVLEVIRDYLRLRAAKTTGRSYNELWSWLKENLNYKGGRSTMQEHIRLHEPDLWKACQND